MESKVRVISRDDAQMKPLTNLFVGYLDSPVDSVLTVDDGRSSFVGGCSIWCNQTFQGDIECDECGHRMQQFLQIHAPIEKPIARSNRALHLFVCLKCGDSVAGGSWKAYRSQSEKDIDELMENIDGQMLKEKNNDEKPLSFGFTEADVDGGIFGDDIDMDDDEDPFASLVAMRDEAIAGQDEENNNNLHEAFDVKDDAVADVVDFSDSKVRSMWIDIVEWDDDDGDVGEKDAWKKRVKLEKKYAKMVSESSGGEKYESSSAQDKDWARFQKMIQSDPERMLQYRFGGKPMWISSVAPKSNLSAPRCSQCGSKCIFECQVLPAILYLMFEKQMLLEKDAKMPEFGVVAIYTCIKSCDSSSPVQQVVVTQQSL